MEFKDIELRHIKDLMAAMGRTGTKKLTLKQENFELHLERPDQIHKTVVELPHEVEENYIVKASTNKTNHALAKGGPIASNVKHLAEEPPTKDDNAQYITSPMVGTFYTTPAPNEPAFAKVGGHIEKGTVVCIIEAMKVMNEIKSEVSGVISEVLVETGHPVEFGTKLFKIV